MDRPRARVPDTHRKDAAQPGDDIQSPAHIGLENNLGIGSRKETRAARFQLPAQFLEIVDLTVEGNGTPRGRIDHRLCPGLAEIDDGEAAMCKNDLPMIRTPRTRPIRSSVPDCIAYFRHARSDSVHPPLCRWTG